MYVPTCWVCNHLVRQRSNIKSSLMELRLRSFPGFCISAAFESLNPSFYPDAGEIWVPAGQFKCGEMGEGGYKYLSASIYMHSNILASAPKGPLGNLFYIDLLFSIISSIFNFFFFGGGGT